MWHGDTLLAEAEGTFILVGGEAQPAADRRRVVARRGAHAGGPRSGLAAHPGSVLGEQHRLGQASSGSSPPGLGDEDAGPAKCSTTSSGVKMR